jgi:hypothetical protein
MVNKTSDWLLQVNVDKLIAVESDRLYETTIQLAETAARALKKAQINGLQNVCYSTKRLSDIYNFIKKQTGKSEKGKDWRKNDFGKRLLTDLESLAERARSLVEQLALTDAKAKREWERRVHLILCREYVKHLAAHYFFKLNEPSGAGAS